MKDSTIVSDFLHNLDMHSSVLLVMGVGRKNDYTMIT
jgi:hypothetical protein